MMSIETKRSRKFGSKQFCKWKELGERRSLSQLAYFKIDCSWVLRPENVWRRRICDVAVVPPLLLAFPQGAQFVGFFLRVLKGWHCSTICVDAGKPNGWHYYTQHSIKSRKPRRYAPIPAAIFETMTMDTVSLAILPAGIVLDRENAWMFALHWWSMSF